MLIKTDDPAKVTYGQQKLLVLLENRNLTAWGKEVGVAAPTLFRIAKGEIAPSYNVMCRTMLYISPIEWLFFSDEELPYEPVLRKPFDPSITSRLVADNIGKWNEISAEFGFPKPVCYNMFSKRPSSKPSVEFMRAFCVKADPIGFFEGVPGEKTAEAVQGYIPEQGDFVSFSGNLYVVVSKYSWNSSTKSASVLPFVSGRKTACGIPYQGKKFKGSFKPSISSISLDKEVCLYAEESVSSEQIKKIMEEIF